MNFKLIGVGIIALIIAVILLKKGFERKKLLDV